GLYFNKTLGTLTYTPDLSQQGYTGPDDSDISGRLTFQATSKQKINFQLNRQNNCMCYLGLNATTSPEASTKYDVSPIYFPLATWSYASTSRLLFQAGVAYNYAKVHFEPTGGFPEQVVAPGRPLNITAIPVTELTTGFKFGPKADGLNVTDYGQIDGSQVN